MRAGAALHSLRVRDEGHASRRVIGAAAVLFLAVFVLRLLSADPQLGLGLLYVLPVALVGRELGWRAGLVAALVGVALLVAWAVRYDVEGIGPLWWLTRAGVFLLVGVGGGILGGRLSRAERETVSLFELAAELACTLDAEGRFTRVNPAWRDVLGHGPEELGRMSFLELVHEDDRDRMRETTRALIAEPGRTAREECRFRHTDGSFRTILWSARGVDEDAVLALGTDITERKHSELVVEREKDAAERANVAKSEFLSRMSHELRTPLNAILGFGQLLELDERDPQRLANIREILKAGRHLLRLIDEVLDISRIEAGRMTLSVEPVHLRNAVGEATSLITPLAAERGITVERDFRGPDDLHVSADSDRLKQVLINLLSNAVKYNRENGRITVAIEPGDGRVRVAISDTGPGLSEEQQQRLFQPFERLGAERTRVEGTGLGLALSRSLMHAMGGFIDATSEPERGSTFAIVLDTAQFTLADETVVAAVSPLRVGAEATVLQIEDNLSNLTLIETILGRFANVRLLSAMQGGLGLDLAQQHRPDLILLDVHLPDLNGAAVLERLKADPRTASIPVVMVSADASTSTVSRLLEAGAADYLTKPLDIPRFVEVLNERLGQRPATHGG